MYRILLKSGNELVFQSLEELTRAVRSGVVSPEAQIYHQKAGRWIPITSHPHYHMAKGGASAPATPPAPASSGERPAVRASAPQAPVATLDKPGPARPEDDSGSQPAATALPPRRSRELVFVYETPAPRRAHPAPISPAAELSSPPVAPAPALAAPVQPFAPSIASRVVDEELEIPPLSLRTIEPAAISASVPERAARPGKGSRPVRIAAAVLVAVGAIGAVAVAVINSSGTPTQTTELSASTNAPSASPAPAVSVPEPTTAAPAPSATRAAAPASTPAPVRPAPAPATATAPAPAPGESAVPTAPQLVAAPKVDLNVSTANLDLSPDVLGSSTASGSGPRLTPTELATHYTAAYGLARAQLDARMTQVGFENLLAPSRLASRSSLEGARDALTAASQAMKDYRSRTDRIERAYQDSLVQLQRGGRAGPKDVSAAAAKLTLQEPRDAAESADLLLNQMDNALALLIAQEGNYRLSAGTIAFSDASAGREYASLRTWLAGRTDTWAGTPAVAVPPTIRHLLAAIGGGLPRVAGQN